MKDVVRRKSDGELFEVIATGEYSISGYRLINVGRADRGTDPFYIQEASLKMTSLPYDEIESISSEERKELNLGPREI